MNIVTTTSVFPRDFAAEHILDRLSEVGFSCLDMAFDYCVDADHPFAGADWLTMALSEGTSVITESIFENRFKYLDELTRMGAIVRVEGNTAIIEGVEKLSPAYVSAPDLRAGAALCIAGLATEGFTIVDDIVYIQRGYENFEEKLRGLGGLIERVTSEREIQKFKLKVS